MMIEKASFLNGLADRRLDQVARFMDACNASGVSFRIAPDEAGARPVDLDIRYSAEPYEGLTPGASVALATRSGPASLRTYLFFEAVGLLALVADQPAWLKIMRDLDPSMPREAVWAAYDLDSTAVFRPDLRPMATGSFIAPRAGGYVSFSVDTRGEVRVHAESEHLAVIAFNYAADLELARLRVDEKLGRFSKLHGTT